MKFKQKVIIVDLEMCLFGMQKTGVNLALKKVVEDYQ